METTSHLRHDGTWRNTYMWESGDDGEPPVSHSWISDSPEPEHGYELSKEQASYLEDVLEEFDEEEEVDGEIPGIIKEYSTGFDRLGNFEIAEGAFEESDIDAEYVMLLIDLGLNVEDALDIVDSEAETSSPGLSGDGI